MNKVLLVDSESDLQKQQRTDKLVGQMLQRLGVAEDQVEICHDPTQVANLRCKPDCLLVMGPEAVAALLPEPFDKAGVDIRRGYVEWSPELGLWAIPTIHPNFIARGNQKLTGVWMNDVQHALDIAKHGHTPAKIFTLEDPTPMEFLGWVNGYEAELQRHGDTVLSYDIETLGKQSKDEDEIELGDASYEIIRIGFSYRPDEAVSIPWSAEFMPGIVRLMGSAGIKLGWNTSYDRPRVESKGIVINGPQHDGMWAWHVANSDLRKNLGFVATFYAWDQPRWKHLGHVNPAYYNALDAAVTLKIYLGVGEDLHELNLWDVYLRHVCELDQNILWKMSKAGVLLDDGARRSASTQLEGQMAEVNAQMETIVPIEARRLKVFKQRKAADRALAEDPNARLVEIPSTRKAKVCTTCGEIDITKPHVTKKTLKNQTLPLIEGVVGPKENIKVPNPCLGAEVVTRQVGSVEFGVTQPFTPSNTQMIQYQRVAKHKPVLTREKRPTFDDDALKRLQKTYPKDELYPLVLAYRNVEKILSTYIGYWNSELLRWDGGLEVGTDGRVHATYLHNPSTLRLSSQNPNVQVWPRGMTPEAKLVKRLVIANPGYRLCEADFSAIEAVLVGYFAGSANYIRLAKLGIHDYVLSHILHRAGTIKAPADLTQSDADLRAFYADLKKRYNGVRDVAKRVVHMSNYGGTPQRMNQSNPESFPTVKTARELQALYFDICPEVKVWQEHTVAMADRQGYLRNPFGYLHRFWQVRNWVKERDGRWVASWGEDAKRGLAFLPQSTASGLLKEAMLRLQHTTVAPYMRLQVHDSLLCEIPEGEVDEMCRLLRAEMEKPSEYLPLNPAWDLGNFLSIGTETKTGLSWGQMEEWNG